MTDWTFPPWLRVVPSIVFYCVWHPNIVPKCCCPSLWCHKDKSSSWRQISLKLTFQNVRRYAVMMCGGLSLIRHGCGLCKLSYFSVYFIVLCHGRHIIHHGMSIRMKVVTLGMNLWGFALSKPGAKHYKSIPLVTTFIRIPYQRLCCKYIFASWCKGQLGTIWDIVTLNHETQEHCNTETQTPKHKTL